ncbi:MFS transporter [Streptomyces inhibens]|uniref:MFS transporter n=1 Tax=Streptomyces inhibens TaxID=2293571 RepID=A0A371PVB1_STRIH|nr:MFS transporter [Streptomyces inhibens]REK86399.1 MFS transporter [Streptomyces inhibens]
MYVADSRTTPAPADPGTRPGGRGRALPHTKVATALRAVPRTVFVLGTVSLITDISSEMVTAVLPLYLVAALGLSPLGFGLLDGVYNGVSALVRLAGSHLADRGGRHKAAAAAGYGLSALCKPALLLVHSVPLISVVLAADRTGKGLRTAPRDAMISLASTPQTQGRSFGVHRAMDTAGALLGPVTAFAILRVTAGGYDAVFTVSFCVAVTGVLVLLLFVPGRTPTAGTSAPAARVSLAAAVGLLRRAELRRLTLCALLLGLATVSDSFVYLLLQRRLDLGQEWFPLLPIATAGSFLLLAVPLGQAADRWGRWPIFLAGHVGLLVAYGLVLAPVHTRVLPVVAVVLVLHGAFYAATDGVLMAAAAGVTPPELRSSGLALVQTGQAGARFVCSVLFGAAWTAWGERTALSAAAVALAACAGICARLQPLRTTTEVAATGEGPADASAAAGPPTTDSADSAPTTEAAE